MAARKRTKMPKKRHVPKYGEGAFYYRDTDDRWVGVIEAGISSKGTRRRIVVTHKDEDECWDKFLTKRKKIGVEGTPAEGIDAGMTVERWGEKWIEIHRDHVRPRVWVTDRSRVTKWIIPTIGRVHLDQLTADHLRQVAKAVRQAGKSSTTANGAQTTLLSMLKAARADGYPIPERIFAAKKAPIAVSGRRALTVPEAIEMLKAADKLPDGARWYAAIIQGLRRGEALGLTWDRVDFDNLTLDISWQLQALPYADRKADTFYVPDDMEVIRIVGAFHWTRPKTRKSKRIIPLIRPMALILKEWKKVAPESPHGLVWPRLEGKHPGWPRNYKDDQAEWDNLQKAAGVAKVLSDLDAGTPPRYFVPHEARHSTASFLMAAGVDRKVIEEILGQEVLVEDYVHVDLDQARTALDNVGKMLQIGS